MGLTAKSEPEEGKPPSRRLFLLAMGSLSGLLLFASDYPLHAWPLQGVALVPLLAALTLRSDSMRHAAGLGLWTGLFYMAPLLIVLRFPFFMGVGLALYQILIWTVFSLGAVRLLRWSSPGAALAVGALSAILEWVNFSLIPVWGTAQCFARVWSACPPLMQIVSFTGMTGLVFLVVSTQVLLVFLVFRGGERGRTAIALVILGILWALPHAVGGNPTPRETVRLAAMGWTAEALKANREFAPTGVSLAHYERHLSFAVEEGAHLVVSPETGFWLSSEWKAKVLERLKSLARKHGVLLAVGYFDVARNDNRIAFIDERGTLEAEYTKTHLIPVFETYRAGSGEAVVVTRMGFRLGGMICQDDNFTDVARAYGRKRIDLMAVPTNDWKAVKDFHFENVRFRAVENRFAVVRAASNGISAILSRRGEILARMDHFEKGPGVILADVPLIAGGTFFSALWDWFPLLCLGFLVGLWAGGGGLVIRLKGKVRNP
ncbi:MAG: apolipoprotein N-acyltransferase [Planctomycetota bacterium]|jgi:apolipoprotein N-acyltransferase